MQQQQQIHMLQHLMLGLRKHCFDKVTPPPDNPPPTSRAGGEGDAPAGPVPGQAIPAALGHTKGARRGRASFYNGSPLIACGKRALSAACAAESPGVGLAVHH